jgi:hypothetical protein
MTPVGVSSRVTVVGWWGGGWCRGLSASRVEVEGRRSGYRQELVLGMIVLV